MIFLTAISIGLLGSLHCVGMCGPIALALPLDRSNQAAILKGNIFYNLGRLLSYFTLGIILGLIGKGFAFAGLQQKLSITLGAFMLISALVGYRTIENKISKWAFLPFTSLKKGMGNLLKKKSPINLFRLGILNGFLPCGMVYMALMGALAMANAFEGGLFMFFFGLGTLPLMTFVGVYGNRLSYAFASKLRQFIPLFIFLFGILFIIRGMNLGIPYLSPEIQLGAEITKCH